MKILIIEDEKDLSQSIKEYLTTEDYICEQAFTFQEAMKKVALYEYDCILLDLMLPQGNGLDILRKIKQQHNPAGVIIVSAKDSLDDKINGLKIGADDYLPKPFHMSELYMRIYALIRRRQFDSNNMLDFNEIKINLISKELTVNDHPVTLTKTEYELLLFLIGNKNKVISKSAIAEHLSGDMADMLDNFDFVYAHIKNLKSKLQEQGCADYIKNVYGTGYKWTS
ncbi:MAG: response regulator transcription factor [Bacteroidaceae bacterium]